MKFEWDRDKARKNLAKHGVDFADAVTVLGDDLALTKVDDEVPEQRFVTVGVDAEGRLLVVIYTVTGEVVRLISARRATKRERRQYEEG